MKNRTKNFYITLVCLFGILTSCAEPKYIEKNNSSNQNVSGQELQADCSLQFQNSKLCFTWKWESEPSATVMGSIILKTYRLNYLDQTAVETDMISIPELVLWMPSMGHGSSPTASERLDMGTYRIKNVFFIMPGDWEFRFQINKDNEKIDEAIISIFIN